MRIRIAAAALGFALAPPASAQGAGLRDYCPDRPGLGTPPCVIDRGHASFELGIGDSTRDRDGTTRSDTLVGGDLLLRYGLTDAIEARIGWVAVGRLRERDSATGERRRAVRTGDVSAAMRANLRNPDGSGLSFALMPMVTLPTGRQPIGAGDWAAMLLAPIGYALNDSLSIALTPEVDAAVDEDGNGRHLAYSIVAGLAVKLSDRLSTTVEYQQVRDRDPSGHVTEQVAGLSLGWMLNDDLQIDLGANLGLDRDSEDSEIYFGLSRRF